MRIPELLAPAGSFEGVRAAVQSGATAVYIGFGTFNARRGAKNFSREEMAEAIRYCRARGVKTNITFNIVALDREREAAMQDVKFLNNAGADALIVQDLGLAKLIRECAPDLPLHASTQMTVHTLDGALLAKKLGFSRVVLSRECSLWQIQEITAKAGVETEVFVHGALCMCYSGQCYLSSVIGQRSGNRGLCAQPCRLPYRYDGAGKGKKETYPLSLKDLCLAGRLQPLVEAGVSSFKIEGRMKRPEYAAVVTDIYSRLLREDRCPTREEMDALRRVFSRDGFTDGYLTGQKGDKMFGTKTDVPLDEVKPLYDEAARRFAEGKEAPLVPVSFSLAADETGLLLNVWDGETDGVTVTDLAPIEPAQNRPATEEGVRKSLVKTGGTPFFAKETKIHLADGLMIPTSRLNALRRDALDRLMEQRGRAPVRRWQDFRPEGSKLPQQAFRGYTVEVRSLTQITDEMARIPPETVYAPLTALADNFDRTREMCEQGMEICAVLPRIYSDGEQRELLSMLSKVRHAGVHTALAGNVGQVLTLREQGMDVYGDFGLNVCNSDALCALNDLGVKRQTLSFELRLTQLRDMRKPIDTELLVYGYLPLMVFENCAIRRKTGKCLCKSGLTTLTDRTGKHFALLPEYGCRNTLLNSQPLYLGDKPGEYTHLGVAYARLRFTTESPARCGEIYLAHVRETVPEFPEGKTRGLYYRGVE